MNKSKRKAYYEEAYPPMPTQTTQFWRKEIFFQSYRFIVLNIKIIRIVVLGHS
jgi:hypothetical protein